jgi:hypothetical protein
MADGVQDNAASEATGEVVEGITGSQSFSASVPEVDPLRPKASDTPRPDHIPEKFWDPVKGEVRLEEMAKSYSELESKIGQPKAEAEEETAEEATEETTETTEESTEETTEDTEESSEESTEEETSEETEPALKSAVEAAQKVYAEKGELDADARQPLIDAGITNDQIDFYIQGVKAQEQALRMAAEKAADGTYEDVEAAIAWAAENWTEKRIVAFNAQTGDVETIGPAVESLMKDYRAANPSEGSLTNVNSGVTRGDVYTHADEFAADLKEADEHPDAARGRVLRRAALDKQQRSLKARSIKS